jgi:hypothetical protein
VTYLIMAFGLLIIIGSMAVLIRPRYVFDQFRTYRDSQGLQVIAVAVRFVMGIILILAAGQTRFPVIVAVLGWLSIMAALALMVIGRARFQRLIDWALSLPSASRRAAPIAGIVLGSFLVFAAA